MGTNNNDPNGETSFCGMTFYSRSVTLLTMMTVSKIAQGFISLKPLIFCFELCPFSCFKSCASSQSQIVFLQCTLLEAFSGNFERPSLCSLCSFGIIMSNGPAMAERECRFQGHSHCSSKVCFSR